MTMFANMQTTSNDNTMLILQHEDYRTCFFRNDHEINTMQSRLFLSAKKKVNPHRIQRLVINTM
jgi:hypothetical protein